MSSSNIAHYSIVSNPANLVNSCSNEEIAAPLVVIVGTVLLIGALVSVACTCHDNQNAKVDLGDMTEQDFRMKLLP